MTIDLSKFKPNLAASPPKDFDWATFPFETNIWLASPKIDGIRVICHPLLGPVTRSLEPVPNNYIRNYLNHPKFRWLDGEVVLNWQDPKTFNKTQSAVMSYEGTPSFEYRVFDHIEAGNLCGFGIRLNDAASLVFNMQDDHVHMAPHIEMPSHERFQMYEEMQVSLGFEGIMLRDKRAKYKFGRSTWKEGGLIKVKRFEDAEGQIIGWAPLERNGNEAYLDNLGMQKRTAHQANMVIDKTMLGKFELLVLNGEFQGKTVRCGSGLTEAERIEYCQKIDSFIANKQVVTFKYQAHGSKDAPRIPIFKGLRGNE